MTARQADAARHDPALRRRAEAEAIIARLLAEAPPLGDAQRARLGPLLDLTGSAEPEQPTPPRPRRRARRAPRRAA